MAKSTRKLSLKKETLRQLDSDQLARVAGGDYDYLSRIAPPPTGTCTCDTVGCLQLNLGIYAYKIYLP